MEQVEYEIDNETLKVILPNEVDHCNTVSIRKKADLHIYSGRVKNVEFDFSNFDPEEIVTFWRKFEQQAVLLLCFMI